jgi:hypothetical protein
MNDFFEDNCDKFEQVRRPHEPQIFTPLTPSHTPPPNPAGL